MQKAGRYSSVLQKVHSTHEFVVVAKMVVVSCYAWPLPCDRLTGRPKYELWQF